MPETAAPLHLVKLSVGTRDIEHLRRRQVEHAAALPPLRHRTRSFPRRHREIVSGGSIFWVVGGLLLARQRVLDVVEDRRDDGTPCTAFLLDPALVAVLPRPLKPFQGWRYLEAAQAPPDLDAQAQAAGEADMPLSLRLHLRALCLL